MPVRKVQQKLSSWPAIGLQSGSRALSTFPIQPVVPRVGTDRDPSLGKCLSSHCFPDPRGSKAGKLSKEIVHDSERTRVVSRDSSSLPQSTPLAPLRLLAQPVPVSPARPEGRRLSCCATG